MRLSLDARRYLISLLAALAVLGLMAGAWRINASARSAMSENAVPVMIDNGNGIIESVFEGHELSALRSGIAKIFPYAALVVEILIYVFFSIVEARL